MRRSWGTSRRWSLEARARPPRESDRVLELVHRTERGHAGITVLEEEVAPVGQRLEGPLLPRADLRGRAPAVEDLRDPAHDLEHLTGDPVGERRRQPHRA